MAQTRRSIKPFNLFTNISGQNEDTGIMTVQPDSAELIENMHFGKSGQWSALNQGYSHWNNHSDLIETYHNVNNFTSSDGTEYIVAATDEGVFAYDLSSGVYSQLIVAYGPANGVVTTDLAALVDGLYYAANGKALRYWDGVSAGTANATGWPVINGSDSYDKPSRICSYANRLVTANFENYPSTLILSDDLDPTTYTLGVSGTDGVVIPISPGDGEEITGLKVLMNPSIADQSLIIFKTNSIYSLSGNTPGTFYLYKVNGSYGAINQKSIVSVGNDIIFMAEDNIYSLTTSTQSGTIQPVALGSQKIKDELADIDKTLLYQCWSVHIPSRNEVWFGFPTSTTTTKILVYNYRKDGNEAWSVKTGFNESCATVFNDQLFTGSRNTQYINKWFASSSKSGTGINWTYTYPYFNFQTQNQNKRIIELYAWFILNREETITFSYSWRNGGNTSTRSFSRTLTIPDASSSIYGTAVYGTAIYGGGEGTLVKVKLPVMGNGDQLQLSFEGTTGTSGPVFIGCSGLVEYMGYDRSYK